MVIFPTVPCVSFIPFIVLVYSLDDTYSEQCSKFLFVTQNVSCEVDLTERIHYTQSILYLPFIMSVIGNDSKQPTYCQSADLSPCIESHGGLFYSTVNART